MTQTSVTPAPPSSTSPLTHEQHSIGRSVLLHLAPGAVLAVFIVVAAPVVAALGFPPVFALFIGIGLVIAPIELGYLAVHAKRTTGSWSPLRAVSYRERLPRRRYVAWAAGLAVWFLAFFLASAALLDEWLATTVFAWMPEAILQFARVEDGEPMTAGVIAVLLVVAFVFNGLVGPVTEELYFRGHLLPRIDRLGNGAPVLNTVLFTLYHFWSPWKYPAILIGFLPIAWKTTRTRSVYLAIAAHVTINTLFLILLTAAFLESSA